MENRNTKHGNNGRQKQNGKLSQKLQVVILIRLGIRCHDFYAVAIHIRDMKCHGLYLMILHITTSATSICRCVPCHYFSRLCLPWLISIGKNIKQTVSGLQYAAVPELATTCSSSLEGRTDSSYKAITWQTLFDFRRVCKVKFGKFQFFVIFQKWVYIYNDYVWWKRWKRNASVKQKMCQRNCVKYSMCFIYALYEYPVPFLPLPTLYIEV